MKEGYEPIENASRDEIAALQLERLKATAKAARESIPHYRRSFDEAGVDPGDIRSLDDLKRFPFTVKDDLRRNYPTGMFAVPKDKIARIHASSGTTGKPTVVGYTAGDIDVWATVVARSIWASGGRPGDLIHNAYGYGLFTGGLGAHYGAQKLGCPVIPASGGFTQRQAQLIADLKPRIIMVTPSYMLSLLDEMESQGADPEGSSLEIGIFGAEPWSDDMRAEVERRGGMHAVDIYGLSEVMGPGVANECVETKDGLTVWEDHFYPEIIDPDTGEVLPDGELGELVLTTLTKEATPLIRYRTRDMTRLLPGTARSMRRLEKITGRSDDMLIIRGVNLYPSQIESLLLRLPALAPHYQLLVDRKDNLDRLTVAVEARPDAGEDAAEEAARKLEGDIKGFIGISAQAAVNPPGAVERSQGKARRIVDKRDA